MNGWWVVAGAMFVISAVLWLLVGTRLAAANPSTRLPLFGQPPNKPRGLTLLQFFANGSAAAGTYLFVDGFLRRGDRHLYDALWGVPIVVIVILVALVPYVRHNRRVRLAALRSAGSQRTGY
jgi:hypothetical protein